MARIILQLDIMDNIQVHLLQILSTVEDQGNEEAVRQRYTLLQLSSQIDVLLQLNLHEVEVTKLEVCRIG